MIMRAVAVTAAVWVCSSGCSTSSSNSNDGGADGAVLGANTNVTSACQSCLAQASGNDCAAQDKNCSGDPQCVTLNTCIDKCANFANCPLNCESAASTNAANEWTSWWKCACSDCASQCASTFCPAGNGDAGNGDGGDGSTCLPDNSACASSSQCCSALCASDSACGCIPTGDPSNLTDCSDCCSGNCDQNNNCL